MSSATPTPLPGRRGDDMPSRRNDEVTQPNAAIPPTAEEARRGLTRSPAQWEAEALAMVEEADARAGVAAGVLRYAAARTVAAKAELAVLKAGLLENPLGARDRARAVIEEALSLVPGHTAALLALEESAIRGGDGA